MDVKNTLKQCIIKYPMMYDNKLSICRHLFVVNGNGYDWVNGELVDVCSKNTTIKKSIQSIKDKSDKKILEYENDKYFVDDKDFLDKIKSREVERCNGYIDIINNWEELISSDMVMSPDISKDLYPICQYAKIVTIPDDVTDDWLKLAKEFYQLMMDNYEHLSDNNKEWVKKVKFPR